MQDFDIAGARSGRGHRARGRRACGDDEPSDLQGQPRSTRTGLRIESRLPVPPVTKGMPLHSAKSRFSWGLPMSLSMLAVSC